MAFFVGKLKTKPTSRGSSHGQQKAPQTLVVTDMLDPRANGVSHEATNNRTSLLQPSARAVERRDQSPATATAQLLQYQPSSESVRRLRTLIREKYVLDIEVWEYRHVQEAMLGKLWEKAQGSDDKLREILYIFDGWEKHHFEPDEWLRAKQIKDSLLPANKLPASKHILWEESLPWSRKSFDEN